MVLQSVGKERSGLRRLVGQGRGNGLLSCTSEGMDSVIVGKEMSVQSE